MMLSRCNSSARRAWHAKVWMRGHELVMKIRFFFGFCNTCVVAMHFFKIAPGADKQGRALLPLSVFFFERMCPISHHGQIPATWFLAATNLERWQTSCWGWRWRLAVSRLLLTKHAESERKGREKSSQEKSQAYLKQVVLPLKPCCPNAPSTSLPSPLHRAYY
jgi:hypothetical protein